jgi:hypothetical protein
MRHHRTQISPSNLNCCSDLLPEPLCGSPAPPRRNRGPSGPAKDPPARLRATSHASGSRERFCRSLESDGTPRLPRKPCLLGGTGSWHRALRSPSSPSGFTGNEIQIPYRFLRVPRTLSSASAFVEAKRSNGNFGFLELSRHRALRGNDPIPKSPPTARRLSGATVVLVTPRPGVSLAS